MRRQRRKNKDTEEEDRLEGGSVPEIYTPSG